MKLNKIFKSLLLVYIFVFQGCDNGLDFIPLGEVSESIFWQQERDAILAVNAAYGELDGPLMVKELDAVTDIAYRASSGPGTLHDVGSGTIDPTNTAIGSQWDRYYRGVRKANDVITNIGRIEQGDPQLLERLEAEARFLRAFYYTQLTSLWGDVPLILEPLEINDHRPRNPKSEVVDFVITELDGIINANYLPVSYSNEIGRATHGAALTLKARVALRNGRYEMTRDAAQQVMDLGVYELFPHYGQLFQYAGQNSSEVIFDRQ
ncbi:MAG: RagB/SusD family nutrient uptake outer membrane protein, partial [Cyclobacteriaceae bacterium]